MIAQKYKPTTQKALFHKDIVNHIRKWIKNVEDYADDSKPVQQILFLYGPMGCSKTVTVECLFKGYNLYEIDTDTIKSNDKLVETIQGLVHFREKTLANIDKWNQKSRKDKSNMILVDNLELCDKGIENFIEAVYTKHNINIPMVFVCNSIRYKDIFVNYKNCTFLEFKKPSLLELTKLSIDIVKEEDLDLSKQQIKILIEKSEYDIRQLLFLLEQWYYSKRMKHEFDIFIENIQIKNIDKDLNEKMEDVFNYKQRFNFSELFILGSSEPVTMSNSTYQNYINSIDPSIESVRLDGIISALKSNENVISVDTPILMTAKIISNTAVQQEQVVVSESVLKIDNRLDLGFTKDNIAFYCRGSGVPLTIIEI